MLQLGSRLLSFSRGVAPAALALAIVGLVGSEASAQDGLFHAFRARNQAFYGPDFQPTSYADQLGLKGYARSENGGYYGPPQIYSRQYGRIYGFRTAKPFRPFAPVGGTGFGGNSYGY